MNWWVFIQSKDCSGAMSYIYPFVVYDKEFAEDAIDLVLNTYCATRDGQRFLSEPGYRLSSAWAAPHHLTVEVQLEIINQPQYERAEQR